MTKVEKAINHVFDPEAYWKKTIYTPPDTYKVPDFGADSDLKTT